MLKVIKLTTFSIRPESLNDISFQSIPHVWNIKTDASGYDQEIGSFSMS